MNDSEFIVLAKSTIPTGCILNNPGKGTSTIIKYDDNKLCYKRGDSNFYIQLEEFAEAYRTFKGQRINTNTLKKYKPSIFNSNSKGHNCHCTLFFMFLEQMGVVDKIEGNGSRGNSFGVQL